MPLITNLSPVPIPIGKLGVMVPPGGTVDAEPTDIDVEQAEAGVLHIATTKTQRARVQDQAQITPIPQTAGDAGREDDA